MTPETRYARTSDRTLVAYQAFGDGPLDLLVLRSWQINIEHEWAEPVLTGVYRRLASLGRVLLLDRRGTGLSDPIDPDALPTLEDRIDDIRAVMNAIGSERIVPIGLAHGAGVCTVFAATHPERTAGLVLWAPPWSVVRRPPDADVERILAFAAWQFTSAPASRHGRRRATSSYRAPSETWSPGPASASSKPAATRSRASPTSRSSTASPRRSAFSLGGRAVDRNGMIIGQPKTG